MKAQTSMVMILLIAVMFMGIIMFLFSTADVSSNEDYVKLQGSAALTTLLRTDTGNPGSPDKCKRVEDVIHCSLKTPSWICGSSACGNIAEPLVDIYLKKSIDPKLDYYLIYEADSEGRVEIYSNKGMLNKTKLPSVKKVAQKISKPRSGDVDVTLYLAPA